MRTAVAIVLASLVLAPQARAQHHVRREGFWIGFGMGYGTASASCDNCVSGPRTGGITAFVKLGGTPSRNLLIGGAVAGWAHASGGTNETMTHITGSLYYYPVSWSGLFVTTGLGFATYHITAGAVSGTGWGAVAGLGYDIPVSRHASLTPVANVLLGGVGSLTQPGVTGVYATGWKQTLLDVGLGITFH